MNIFRTSSVNIKLKMNECSQIISSEHFRTNSYKKEYTPKVILFRHWEKVLLFCKEKDIYCLLGKM